MIRRYLQWLRLTHGVEPNKAEFVFRLGSYSALVNAACLEPYEGPISLDECW